MEVRGVAGEGRDLVSGGFSQAAEQTSGGQQEEPLGKVSFVLNIQKHLV